MLIYLTGFMGSGKSSVGRALSGQLGVPLIDTDTEIEARTGKRVSDVFASEGEERFREIEARVLSDCSRRGDAVIATGGGVVEAAANVDLMSGTGLVVFLDLAFEELASRVAGDGDNRPLFRDAAAARQRYERRRPAYERCHVRLTPNVDESAEDVARRIWALLEAQCAT